MTEVYPLLFKPVLKDYIWGGRNLEKLGRALPAAGNIAESWEISGHQDGMSVIENGSFAGETLQSVLNVLGEALVGTKNRWALDRGKFPLLVKLIDANRPLSVQVHPSDAYALKHEGNELGKTEMWVVLEAEPDAAIIYGLSEPTTTEALNDAISSGTLEKYLNYLKISKGDHICVPSGTLHAILSGAVIAEIQQNSNTTYRVYDWNRTSPDGKPRELHVEKALDVIDLGQVNLRLPEPELIEKQGSWVCERLCHNSYFTTDRYLMDEGSVFHGCCDGASFEIWGVLSGEVEVAGIKLSGVRFTLLPAALGEFCVTAEKNATVLRTFLS